MDGGNLILPCTPPPNTGVTLEGSPHESGPLFKITCREETCANEEDGRSVLPWSCSLSQHMGLGKMKYLPVHGSCGAEHVPVCKRVDGLAFLW